MQFVVYHSTDGCRTIKSLIYFSKEIFEDLKKLDAAQTPLPSITCMLNNGLPWIIVSFSSRGHGISINLGSDVNGGKLMGEELFAGDSCIVVITSLEETSFVIDPADIPLHLQFAVPFVYTQEMVDLFHYYLYNSIKSQSKG